MMSAEVFRGAVINDVCAMFEGALQVWAHHGVINYDDSIRSAFLDVGSYACEIDDFEERVSGALQENHGGLVWVDVVQKRVRLGCVDMVDGDTAVGLEIGKNTVGATVKVITRDDFIARFEDTQDGIEGSHS